MSKHKSNVHPSQYKVAGRSRQGEDIIHDRQKTMLAQSHAVQEHQEPYPKHVPFEEKHESPSTQAGEVVRAEIRKPSPKRSRDATNALKREAQGAASHAALVRQVRSSARRRAAN
jgi:hypothetical protein